ncbi:MAG: cytochrome c oxidase assembly protein [Rhodothalassiaceae bacterium]
MTPRQKKNLKALLIAGVALGASASLAIFAVPLYRIFCQVTGYGGTTQEAKAAERTVLDRVMQIRFDGSVDPHLPWRFHPLQQVETVKVGETGMAYYEATNLSDRAITGGAVYNVTPHKAGLYFAKIQCFCFTEQTLAPGETVKMGVTYFVDPAIAEDPNMDGVSEITLSYTFYFRNYAETPHATATSMTDGE